eukprot:scaffold1272_cov250-Pinguiococcus_pyrenoidosus.AAC.30
MCTVVASARRLSRRGQRRGCRTQRFASHLGRLGGPLRSGRAPGRRRRRHGVVRGLCRAKDQVRWSVFASPPPPPH